MMGNGRHSMTPREKSFCLSKLRGKRCYPSSSKSHNLVFVSLRCIKPNFTFFKFYLYTIFYRKNFSKWPDFLSSMSTLAIWKESSARFHLISFSFDWNFQVETKSYFRLWQTCRDIDELIKTSPNISVIIPIAALLNLELDKDGLSVRHHRAFGRGVGRSLEAFYGARLHAFRVRGESWYSSLSW